MGDMRGAHFEAVGAAQGSVGEVQEILAVATDRMESAMGAIIMAVGQTPFVESATNAMNFMAEAKSRIEEIYRITEQVNAELERYAGGF